MLRFRVSTVLVILIALPALANTVNVDCSGATPGAFTTVAAALASLPSTTGRR